MFKRKQKFTYYHKDVNGLDLQIILIVKSKARYTLSEFLEGKIKEVKRILSDNF